MKQKIPIFNKKRHGIILVKWLFILYIIIAALVGTACIAVWGMVTYTRYTKTVQLPNGLVLAPTKFNRNHIQILNEQGDTVVTFVDNIMWCNDIVYGERYEAAKKTNITSEDKRENYIGYRFIYDHNTKELHQYKIVGDYNANSNNAQSAPSLQHNSVFQEKLREKGLPEFSYKQSIRYLDVVNGLKALRSDEKCRDNQG